MNPRFDVSAKIVLVTGAARGLGRGIALNLAQSGAIVFANVRAESADAVSLKNELRSFSAESRLIVADVSIPEDVDEMFTTINQDIGRLDILVNNAGITQDKDIEEMTLEDWQRVLDVNLTSNYLCSKKAFELMKRHRWGRIIQISSMVGHQGALFGHVHYAATKSGQLGFTKTLARTGAKYGITVNAIAPGIIETDMLKEVHGPKKIAELEAKVPLGLGKVEDIANAVHFLVSDEAGYITGATLDVNGGMLMR